ncbi:sodium-dependent transporter [Thermococcus sp. MAR1]|uniref:sodium-dependent transporter n=1 Tax=Thermococcus sp. MAR1 TaxID=1638263 RepID=UPI001F0F59B7|nr:sodium-dependent transporter [Thermococcus sp. MAR1]
MSLGYLSLVVAAFMIGLGNIWKFPALAFQHGLGGIIVYVIFVAMMIPLIAVALESTKHKRYELLEYYLKEYQRPAFGFMFLLFNILLLSYYSIVGGWTLSSLVIEDVTSSFTGNIITLLFVFALLILILVRGREKTLDVMVISVGLFFLAVVATIIGMYTTVPDKGAIGHFIGQAFAWKGISGTTIKDMAVQAAYSVSLGMGFYLILGAFLPDEISGTKLASIGVALDTFASILATFVIAMVLAVDPSIPIQGTALLFQGLPRVMLDILKLPALLYLLSFAVFLAALSSMIPIGETIVRIYEEFTRLPREKAVIIIIGATAVIGLANVFGMHFGVDTITVLDGAVSTFVLFGGIIAAWAAIEHREYVPKEVKNAAYPGIVLVGILGLYSLFHMIKGGQYVSFVLLVGIVGMALALNGKLRDYLEAR